MNVKKLNQWLMLAANIGVLGGIVFLAFEIRQNTSQMRTEASRSITEMINSINSDTYSDPNLADLILRGNEDFEGLEPVEKFRYREFQFSRINLAEYILLLDSEGLTELQFPYVESTVNDIRGNPGAMDWLRSVEDGWLGDKDILDMITAPFLN